MTEDAQDKSTRVTVTRLLREVAEGRSQAAEDLLPLVYEQLRALAASKMQQERRDQTLQATALVHEAYLRLIDQTSARWDDRWHFFAAAAEAMRRILVDNARRRGRIKRGGDRQRVMLEDVALTVDDPPDHLIALDDALVELAQKHPKKAELVKLRYFAGLTMDQAAQAMGISVRTAGRDWAYARAWLFDRIKASE